MEAKNMLSRVLPSVANRYCHKDTDAASTGG